MDRRTESELVTFLLNGAEAAVDPVAGERLSQSLRERLGARDVKVGCNAGDCGACTVLIDGAPACACLVPTQQVRGATVETAAGLTATDPDGVRLAQAFLALGASQCGFCTPGMVVSAVALLRGTTAPGPEAVRDALGGVLCRCTGYSKIVEAVVAAGQGRETALPPGGRVGDPIARVDGGAKISGGEVFGDDVAPPEALVLKVIRSPYSRARFRFGDLDAYRARHGLALVLTAAEVPGANRMGMIPGYIDQPVFAEGEVWFRGEAVAAVVAEPERAAALDLAEFPVEWEVLPAALTPEAARAPGAPVLHVPGNVMCRGRVCRGDAEAGLAGAVHCVSGRFRTAFVEHAYLEPEAGYVVPAPEGDGVAIHACTQAPAMNREALASVLGLAPEAVVIRPTAVGGGFGSKLDLSTQPFLAIAALRLGRPVRMAYARSESMQSTTKRHPSDIALEIGADAEGRITGLRFDGVFNTGAYASWGPTVASRVPIHASGPYRMGGYLAETAGVYTNCPPAGAFRGFGVPQATIALELLLDELADALGQDPLAFRIANALRDGEPTVCGQVFESGVGIGACFEALRPGWAAAWAETEAFNALARAEGSALRRGAGVGAGWYGCGNTGLPNPATIRAGITRDGRVVLHQGAVDIGQGSNTVIAQIFAEALGVPVAAVERVGADTDVTPDAGKTSASRQTFITGNAAMRAGAALRAEILRRVNVEDARAEIVPGAGGLEVRRGGETHAVPLAGLEEDALGYVISAEESYDPPTSALDADGQGEPYAQYGYAAQMAVVEVDTRLGTVRPVTITAAHDVGRAINPVLAEGQIQGGVAQGLGMALMEEYLPGRTENLHDYLIPTIGDVPEIETILVEVPDPHGPHGAKGLGEHALIPTAPAILNAIRRATGAVLRQVPVTPDRLRAAILAAGEGA